MYGTGNYEFEEAKEVARLKQRYNGQAISILK